MARTGVRAVIGFALIAITLPGASHASPALSGSFHATVPCALVCQYGSLSWIRELDAFPFSSCDAPFPPGSYDETTVTVPEGVNIARFEIRPRMDWDASLGGPDGFEGWLSRGELDGTPCDGPVGPDYYFGCREFIDRIVAPGEKYLIRGYMYADVDDCPWSVTFRFV